MPKKSGGSGRSGGRKQGGGTATRSQEGSHDDVSTFFDDDPDKATKEYARVLNVSEDRAREMLEAIQQYTGESYSAIRSAEFSGKETPQTKAINEFLSKAPVYKGEIFRGLNFKSEKEIDGFLDSVSKGAKLGAMSSFSSDVKVGFRFAKGESQDNPGKFGVIIRVINNKSGASVQKASDYSHKNEKEVLVPKNATYSVISAKTNPKFPGMRIVTLEEK